MILALDVGNSQIFGGVYHGDSYVSSSARTSRPPTRPTRSGFSWSCAAGERRSAPADRAGRHLLGRPGRDLFARSCCRKYFELDPFILRRSQDRDSRFAIATRSRSVPIASPTRSRHASLSAVRTSSSWTSARRRPIDVVSADREYLGGSSCRVCGSRWKRSRRRRRGCHPSRSSCPPRWSVAAPSRASSPAFTSRTCSRSRE